MKVLRHTCVAMLAVVVTACESQAPWPSSGVFVGYYQPGFEKSDFKPVGTPERWWLSGNIKSVRDLFVAPSRNQPPKIKRPVYLVVRGSLSPVGRYGHLNQYTRELSVVEVIEVREVKTDEIVVF